MTSRFYLASLVAATLAWPLSALGADRFEIQVYDTDVNDPGSFALEMHTNFTPVGKRVGDYAGQIPQHRAGHLTFEPAVGLTDFLELGGYLQFLAEPGAGAQFAGAKGRLKFVAPERLHLPLHLGLNIEVGRVPHGVEQSGWANEFRPIIAWTDGVWLVDVNPIFGYALTGAAAFKPEFEPCAKLAWNTQHGFAVGAEYYSGLGLISEGFSTLRDQEHIVFATFDLAEAKDAHSESNWEFNAGIGRGLTSGTAATWEIKTIVGKGF